MQRAAAPILGYTDTDTDTAAGDTDTHPRIVGSKCVRACPVGRSLSQSLKIDYKRLHNQSQNQRDFLTVIVFLVLYSNFCPYDHEWARCLRWLPQAHRCCCCWLLAAGCCSSYYCWLRLTTHTQTEADPPQTPLSVAQIVFCAKMLIWFYIFALKQTNRHSNWQMDRGSGFWTWVLVLVLVSVCNLPAAFFGKGKGKAKGRQQQ